MGEAPNSQQSRGADATTAFSESVSVTLPVLQNAMGQMHQTMQQQFGAMMDMMMQNMQQHSLVMSRLARLEKERDSQRGVPSAEFAGLEQLVQRLQQVSLTEASGVIAGAGSMDATESAVPGKSSKPAMVAVGHSADVQLAKSRPASTKLVQSTDMHTQADKPQEGQLSVSQKGNVIQPSGPSASGEAAASSSGMGEVMVDGVHYAWQLLPEGLRLERVSDGNKRAESPADVLRGRAMSPFHATSVHHELMTPNIRRFHTASPPRSRSGPKTRPPGNSPLKRAEPGLQSQAGKAASQVNLSSPAANAKAASSLTPLYDVSPGRTVIRPPPEVSGGQAMNSWGWSSVGPTFAGPFGSPPKVPSEFRISGPQD